MGDTAGAISAPASSFFEGGSELAGYGSGADAAARFSSSAPDFVGSAAGAATGSAPQPSSGDQSSGFPSLPPGALQAIQAGAAIGSAGNSINNLIQGANQPSQPQQGQSQQTGIIPPEVSPLPPMQAPPAAPTPPPPPPQPMMSLYNSSPYGIPSGFGVGGGITPPSMPPSQPDPARVRNLLADRQSQGLYSGGASTPESVAALMQDPTYTPEFIQSVMQGKA